MISRSVVSQVKRDLNSATGSKAPHLAEIVRGHGSGSKRAVPAKELVLSPLKVRVASAHREGGPVSELRYRVYRERAPVLGSTLVITCIPISSQISQHPFHVAVARDGGTARPVRTFRRELDRCVQAT